MSRENLGGASSRGSMGIGPLVATLKSGPNVDLTENILLMSMCWFCVALFEHAAEATNIRVQNATNDILPNNTSAMYPFLAGPGRGRLCAL